MDKQMLQELLAKSVDELEMSVRTYNCFKNANLRTLYEVVQQTEQELLKSRNFGRKSLNEVKELLDAMGLSLGMNLPGFAEPIAQFSQVTGPISQLRIKHPAVRPTPHPLTAHEWQDVFRDGRNLKRIFGEEGVRYQQAKRIVRALMPFRVGACGFAPPVYRLAPKMRSMLEQIRVLGYPIWHLSISERRRDVQLGAADEVDYAWFDQSHQYMYTPLTWRAFPRDSRLSQDDFIHVLVASHMTLKREEAIWHSIFIDSFLEYKGGGLACHFTVSDVRAVVIDILDCHVSFLALGWLEQARITARFIKLIRRGNIPMGIVTRITQRNRDLSFLVVTA